MTAEYAHLLQPLWSDDAIKLCSVIGRENIWAVGGAVRDALLGRAVNDVDFATVLPPDDVINVLKVAGIDVRPTGYEHGTVTAIFGNNRHFEITTFREDVETHGRRAVVKFAKDIQTDAQRRDFTINALYATPQNILIDSSGQGLDDLQTKTLRFIGDAQTRIQEDYLRILRLFRFVGQLGFTADNEALIACGAEKSGLSVLSGERVTSEWDKLLCAPHAQTAFFLMKEVGLRDVYAFHEEAGLRLATLPAGYGSLALRYTLSFENNILNQGFVFSRRRARDISCLLNLSHKEMSWQECAFRYGLEMAEDFYLADRARSGQIADPETLASLRSYTIPVSPVQSEDYIKQGLSGEKLGLAIKQATEAWIKEYFGAPVLKS